MAERRMFAKTIVDSDAFLDMPLSTQALYFHLAMRADDDGFLNNAKKIVRIIGANKNDYDLLIAKRFIIQFDGGICVIKHWLIHNLIRSDRYKPTMYQEEKKMLNVKENKSYTLSDVGIPNGNQLETDGDKCDAQVRLGKESIGKESIGEVRKGNSHFVPPTIEEITAYCKERKNNVDPEKFFYFYDAKDWMVGKSKMKKWKSAIVTWEKRDTKQTDVTNDENNNNENGGIVWQ